MRWRYVVLVGLLLTSKSDAFWHGLAMAPTTPPCDTAATASTPCVAAYSLNRANVRGLQWQTVSGYAKRADSADAGHFELWPLAAYEMFRRITPLHGDDLLRQQNL